MTDKNDTRSIEVPALSLVVLMGASGSGKSTFAKKHFLDTEVLSSDTCRALVSDDATSLDATKDAFELLHHMLEIRLRRRRLTVVDATNVQRHARKALLDIARTHHCLTQAIALNMPEALCQERNATRPDRAFGAHVVRNHTRALKKSLRHLQREGFRRVHVFDSPEDLERVVIARQPLWNDRRELAGPFDIIGDIHGCIGELLCLLERLGYEVERTDDPNYRFTVTPPEGRTAVFLGDLVDRGPATPEVLSLVMGMVHEETALCISGNHEAKLLKAMRGRKVKRTHGLERSMEQLSAETQEFRAAAREFMDGLISHYMLDAGKLCVAHAGLTEDLQGRASAKVRSFALYGDTTGEIDSFGLPVRADWALEYRGDTTVVYGHTPTLHAEWVNNTLCIDTGCVFGGKLTALRYPEREVVSVEAAEVYSEPIRPLEADPARSGQQLSDDELSLEDVFGRRHITTRLTPTIIVEAERTAAALEVITRFGVDPRWMIHLPPTMSPVKTSQRDGLLEHPDEAFAYFAACGVEEVVCEEKHMGSRAIVVALQDPEVAASRFGMTHPSEALGIIMTRTGRRFFSDLELERGFLERLHWALSAAAVWERFETSWICLDAELMPWSAKARALLRRQYAAVGAAATHATSRASEVLAMAHARGVDLGEAQRVMATRQDTASRFVDAYRQYCWEVHSLDDYRLAPFHILATEGAAHVTRDHIWHMRTLAELCDADPSPLLMKTPWRLVTLADDAQRAAAIRWWTERTAAGNEGMVVKPRAYITRDRRGKLVQPALKCRGPEYLRIIYGPEYDAPANLARLRKRGLSRKRGLAAREFALGVDALERFVARRPLREVHERVFAILAMESEPVDPRL
ncbi:MAG: polynucleotide kinase-phosphatase [Myxococcota bacterium]